MNEQSDSSASTVVHVGFGAFHRAHQLRYFQDLNDLGEQWNVCEVSLFSTGGIEALKNQDLRFNILEQHENGQDIKEISCIKEALHPHIDGMEKVIDRLSRDDVELITFTVTENGYGVVPGTMSLDWSNAKFTEDLQSFKRPKTLVGFVASVLCERYLKGKKPLTLLSCDNLLSNGKVLKAAVTEYCRRVDVNIAAWVEAEIAFPCSMVDRIVPAMNKDSRVLLERTLDPEGGKKDAVGVITESFKQWVVEDHFAGRKPALDRVGAMFVEDVAPFEEMKLRMLNGAHSALAYLGFLAGYETVSDAIADLHFRKLISVFMLQEQGITLTTMTPEKIQKYASALIQRFSNPHLHHRLAQIAMDGSQKIPQRIFPAMHINITEGRSHTVASLVIAAWLRYVLGENEEGETYAVFDSCVERFSSVREETGISLNSAKALLADEELFPDWFRHNTALNIEICAAFSRLCETGAKAEVARLSQEIK